MIIVYILQGSHFFRQDIIFVYQRKMVKMQIIGGCGVSKPCSGGLPEYAWIADLINRYRLLMHVMRSVSWRGKDKGGSPPTPEIA